MAYRMYAPNGDKVRRKDLQNKGKWCIHGARKEEVFVDLYGALLGVDINPKKSVDRFAPDLIDLKTGNLGDLKTQNTPFFEAKQRFGLDPQYTVVFNRKDKRRYQYKYPEIDIYFWVDWEATKFEKISSRRNTVLKTVTVQPMEGVWKINFNKLIIHLQENRFHRYSQRTNDKRGNAKGSYVVDLTHQNFVRMI